MPAFWTGCCRCPLNGLFLLIRSTLSTGSHQVPETQKEYLAYWIAGLQTNGGQERHIVRYLRMLRALIAVGRWPGSKKGCRTHELAGSGDKYSWVSRFSPGMLRQPSRLRI